MSTTTTTAPAADHGRDNAAAWADILRELAARHAAAEAGETWRDNDEPEDPEEVAEEARESALAVEVRGGWYAPGSLLDADPVEFRITLTMGGPSLQIIGDIGAHGGASAPRLEYADWSTPWTRYTDARELDGIDLPAALYWFTGLFWLGE